MKGRYIGENISLILETTDITDENNLPGMIFYSDFGILGQVWYLIVSNPDLCTLTYFEKSF